MDPQNQPTNSNPQPMVEPAKKCNHLPIIVILAILVVGGFGFGGFEFWQNMQKDNKISLVETKITEEKNKNQELQAQIDEYKKESVLIEESSELNTVKSENIKMAIDSFGDLWVFDISTKRVLVNANQEGLSMFVSCDSGTLASQEVNPVIICNLEKNNKEQIKFVYNYQTNMLSHN